MITTESRTLPRTDGLSIVPDALNPEIAIPRLARRTLRLGQLGGR